MPTAVKVSARDWVFEISDGAATPTYTQIGGIKTFQRTFSSQEVDTTDFDSDGTEEHEIMARGQGLKLEGFFKEDASKNRDAGQAAVESLAAAVGSASLQDIRITSPNGKKWTHKMSASLDDQGGGNNDKTSWGVTLKRSGGTTVS